MSTIIAIRTRHNDSRTRVRSRASVESSRVYGTFPDVLTLGEGGHALATCDLDGDGDLDIVIEGVPVSLHFPFYRFISVRLNDGDATFRVGEYYTVGNGPQEIALGDVMTLLAAWGECAAPCAADLDGSDDGWIDDSDLAALLTTWGPCPRP